MKYLKFLTLGVVFGIVLSKSEVISWYRIYEMFKFDSFHMYGVIGSAVVLGIVIVQIIKRNHLKSIEGTEITFNPKNMSIPRYLFGGTIFGLGWALTGACPGPRCCVLTRPSRCSERSQRKSDPGIVPDHCPPATACECHWPGWAR